LVASEAVDLGLELKEPENVKRFERTFVRVVGKQGTSFFRAYDFNAIMLYLTSALVLLALPKRFITFFALNCLGQLSKIYRKVVRQDFGVRYACARAVLQSVSQLASFNELADCRGPDGTYFAGISKKHLRRCLQDVVRNRSDELDEKEVAVLAEFAYSQVLLAQQRQDRQRKRENSFFFDLGDLGAFDIDESIAKREEAKTNILDIDAFCQATASEIIGLDTLARLFDADRKIWLGERLFTPHDISRKVHSEPGKVSKNAADATCSCMGFASSMLGVARGRTSSSPSSSNTPNPGSLTVATSTPGVQTSEWKVKAEIDRHKLAALTPNHPARHVSTISSAHRASLMTMFGPQPSETGMQMVQDGAEIHVETTHTSIDAESNIVRTLCISVKRLESIVGDLHSQVEALQAGLQQEQNLRHASETAMREETQRAMKAVSEQAALRTDLAVRGNSRGSSIAGGNENLPSNINNNIGTIHGRCDSGLQPRSVATMPEFIKLRQEVLEAITQQDGRVETLAQRAVERQLELHMVRLEQMRRSEAIPMPIPRNPTPRSPTGRKNPSSGEVTRNSTAPPDRYDTATTLSPRSKSKIDEYHADQAAQTQRLEESLEALAQRVDSLPDQGPTMSVRLPDCFTTARRKMTPSTQTL